MDGEDRHLGLDRRISRRDVLNGVVVGVGGSLASSWLTACSRSLEPAALLAQDHPTYYPPALTGMRGSHDGSWELAHALRDGTFWQQAGTVTDTRETYDLVVVGGGISGLAAAYFFRQQAGNLAGIHALRIRRHAVHRLLLLWTRHDNVVQVDAKLSRRSRFQGLPAL